MTPVPGLELRLLGPVEAYAAGDPLGVGPRKQRLLLAILALEVNQYVSVDRLVELMWTQVPPRTAEHAVRVGVSRLRRALNPAIAAGSPPCDRPTLVASAGGYRLRADPMAIDTHRFRSLAGQARLAGTDPERIRLLDSALALWRGPALSGSAPAEVCDRLCRGLEESRLAAVEDRFEIRLRLGQHQEILAELIDLVAAGPVRERPLALLMLALYRSGRAGDALVAYRQARQRLSDELGMDPGAELRRLEVAILRSDPDLDVPAPDTVTAADRPTAPTHVRPALLPPAMPWLAGRDSCLAELDTALAGPAGERRPAPATIAVSGTAGVGKTAVAVSWAHRAAHRFPDGQLYVDLKGFEPFGAPTAPTEALRRLLDALGVAPERIPHSVGARTDLYRSRLADTRTLVVLDNAASAEQVRPLLPGAPGCLVLVTSRNRLASLVAVEGARSVVLDVLSTDAAWELLRRRLGPGRVAAEPAAVDEIVRRCARLPLALAIVAARAVTRPARSLADFAADLRDTDSPLAPFGAGDPATDLRMVFAGSYRTLSAAAARLFRSFGLQPGPDVEPSVLAGTAKLPLWRTRQVVDELVAANLVRERADGRLALSDLLRSYAAELASTGAG